MILICIYICTILIMSISVVNVGAYDDYFENLEEKTYYSGDCLFNYLAKLKMGQNREQLTNKFDMEHFSYK